MTVVRLYFSLLSIALINDMRASGYLPSHHSHHVCVHTLTRVRVQAAKRNPQWSVARSVNHRSMKNACETRKQVTPSVDTLRCSQ